MKPRSNVHLLYDLPGASLNAAAPYAAVAGGASSGLAANSPIRERHRSDRYRYMRRLVAVAFADVVGYSRMMCEDEDGTVRRWLAIRRNILVPKSRVYRGRLVNVVGDSVLVEFGNVVDAVAWSRDVQGAMRTFNITERDGLQKFELRIAVHVCEVIDVHADIFGDGINIVARLQAHAPPGGVVVSEAVYDVIRTLLDVEAKKLGPLLLKNIAAPICAYLIDPRSDHLRFGYQPTAGPTGREATRERQSDRQPLFGG